MEREAEGGGCGGCPAGLWPEGGKIEARNSSWLGAQSLRVLTVTPHPHRAEGCPLTRPRSGSDESPSYHTSWPGEAGSTNVNIP